MGLACKHCTGCGKLKWTWEYNKSGRGRRRADCRACSTAINEAYNADPTNKASRLIYQTIRRSTVLGVCAERASTANRTSKMLGVCGILDPKDLESKLADQGGVCYCCGVDLLRDDVVASVEHLEPFCNGGTNYLHNVLWSCFDCNTAKGRVNVWHLTGTWFAWRVEWRKQLDNEKGYV